MGKFVEQQVEVVCNSRNIPCQVRWGGVLLQVNVVERWKDTGCWWLEEGEKTFYRLTAGDQLWEIYYDDGRKCWWMYKIYD
ncbi:MAG TPA: hypothetical protein VHS59_06445 [Bacillota bacterium]|nr:hypothetical protein [Bacillota bacterium]